MLYIFSSPKILFDYISFSVEISYLFIHCEHISFFSLSTDKIVALKLDVANFSIWVFPGLVPIGFLFSWEWITFFCFFICWGILNYILNIVIIMLWDSILLSSSKEYWCFYFSRHLAWLDWNCKLYLLSGSSKLSLTLLCLAGICPMHAWPKSQRFEHRLYVEFVAPSQVFYTIAYSISIS